MPGETNVAKLTTRRCCAFVPDMKNPPLLPAGSRVGLVAPSGPLRDPSEVQRAVDTATSLGWETVVGAHVLERSGYLAGTDSHRLADLNGFANDDSINGIWCIRGGYGAMRLLDELDYEAWRRHPKALIGYSDITALHSAIARRVELITYHGTTARAELTAFSRRSFVDAIVRGRDSCGVAHDAVTLRGGRTRGRLVGGNLALVASLLGTPFAPSLDGAILVVEDVNESVYRIDRMFTQLRLSGALQRLNGIAFGQFTDLPDEVPNEERSLSSLLHEIADDCRVPCIAGIPMGHVADQWTIPLGADAELDADARSIRVIR
jgi:muramoyltetrapeptide carboxypeptidase